MTGISFIGFFTVGLASIVFSVLNSVYTATTSLDFVDQRSQESSETQKKTSVSFQVNEGTSANPQYIPTAISERHIQSATAQISFNDYLPHVALQFNEEGANLLAQLTKRQQGKQIGIFINGELVSAPVVQEEIADGKVQINGSFTQEEAETLAQQLSP
jgi:preprotein translocase subunit SecD